jgi:hypothetical protein
MQPIDTHARKVIAADRFERLRLDAERPRGSAGSPRVRFGRLLIAAGLRFAPDALPVSRAGAAPSSPGRVRAARPG